MRAKELLELMVANFPVAIWETDAAGKFTFVASHRIASGQADQATYVGRSIEEIFAATPSVLEAIRRALGGETHRTVIEHGTMQWDAIYRPIRNARGEIVGSTGIAIDVADQRRTLAELRQSEELTQRILEAVPAGIVLVSAKGEILDSNQKAIDLLGVERGAMATSFVEDFGSRTIWEDGTPCPPEAYPVSRCLVTREPQPPVTIGTKRPDGSIAWCVFTAVPAHHPVTKEFIGAVVTFHDITQRKREEVERARLERQLAESQKLEAIGRLAGGLAHDLNNILSAILGHASLLKDKFPPGSEEHHGASTIEIAGERAARLTKQLLAFARQGTQRSEHLDVDRIIAESIDLLSGTLRQNIRITHRRSSTPAMVFGDSTQLQQVFLNLALNAQDAIPESGDLVFETSVNVDRRVVSVSVRDTGLGMSDEVRARMFEPFYTTKEKGTGMGLALCYGIVTAHDGTISVQSRIGAGTTFEIELPLALPQTQPTTSDQAPKKKYVLVVDDEEIVRSTAELLLERLGWATIGASDGAQAVAIYREKSDQIALVILDLVMPSMGGRECFRALRAFNPDVRAIVSSGYDRDNIASDILGAGMAEFLQKPYTLSKLRDAVERALS